MFGAVRAQMAGQFLIESLLMSGMAVCLALLLAAVSLPWFNLLTGKTLVVDTGTTLFAIGAVVVIVVVVGCVSGSYPAFYLSGAGAHRDPQGNARNGFRHRRFSQDTGRQPVRHFDCPDHLYRDRVQPA